MSLPWWEFVLRALIIYFFLILILRLTGKRQIGQMSPFDLVLLLVLSNAVQNSMNGGDNSVLGGLILAGTLVLCNAILNYATARNRSLERWVEGEPAILIYNGKIIQKNLDEQGVTRDELEGAMRVGGCEKVTDIHLATLEINGQISIVRADAGESPKVHQTGHRVKRKGRRTGFGS